MKLPNLLWVSALSLAFICISVQAEVGLKMHIGLTDALKKLEDEDAQQKEDLVFKKNDIRGIPEDHEEAFLKLGVDAKKKNDDEAAMLEYLAREKRSRDDRGFLSGVTCEVCEFAVREVRSLVEESKAIEDILELVSDICIGVDILSRDVCVMIVQEYQDQLLYVAFNLVLGPKEVCGIILGDSCATPYYPGHMWHVKLPSTPKPPPKPPVVPKPDAPTVRVLHLTDIHIDPMYEQGAKADCWDPICCRAQGSSPAGNPMELFLKRHDTLVSQAAGRYGSYNRCDFPVVTTKQLFKHLKSIQDEFDYVLFTGDIPPHDIWNQTKTDQKNMLRLLDRMFHHYLPDKPVFQAVGNHESAPCNSFPPPGIPNHNSSWLYDTLVDVWGRWLPEPALRTVGKCGSFSHSPYPGFRIISINNNYGNSLNFWLLLNATDPCDTLKWLVGELQAAEDSGEKVHLLLHIPPGSASCLKPWSWNFYKIVNRYENTIMNQFYGHDHRDYFQLFYDTKNFRRAVGIGFAAPAVTSYSASNPTFRIYTLDGNYTGSSWAVLDYTSYYLNISEANQEGKLNWRPEYTAKKDLGMKNLYAPDWADLVKRMQHDDELFQKFYSYFVVMNTEGHCKGECKKDLLCQLRQGRSFDPDLCKRTS